METPIADDRPMYEVEVRYDVRIPTADPDVTLSADVYLPIGAPKVPALVSAYPYRKDLLAPQLVGDTFRWFAERGYAGVLVDILGTGSSDGVRRPEFHVGEGDDAVAAIEWAARQDWCTGDVGMWGQSYGAYMAFRAASQRPAALRAILPIEGPIDPERHVVHPDGSRGDFHSMVFRGAYMLVLDLLPSLLDHRSPAERDRWLERLARAEPVSIDFASRPPGDKAWADYVVDVAAIDVPAFCIGGWLDLHSEGIVSAFEQLAGPKKLLMGPWSHFFPQSSPLEPVDFLSLALRWWDHWLRGADNGVPADPAVVVRVPGSPKPWLAFESWPPMETGLELAARGDGTLRPADSGNDEETVGVYHPDPTVGFLSGLWETTFSGTLPAQDQHDDDVRSLAVTTDPLEHDTVLVGRPEVRLSLAGSPGGLDTQPGRLVVRMAQVDSRGRSTFVTAGVLCPDAAESEYRVVLRPIARMIQRGDRLRISVSDADFPRLTTLPRPVPLDVTRLHVSVPVVADGAGQDVDVPAASAAATGEATDQDGVRVPGHRRTFVRDLVADSIAVEVGSASSTVSTTGGHSFEVESLLRAQVARARPAESEVEGTYRATARYTTGETITAMVTVRCTEETLRAQGTVTTDGVQTFTRTWETPLAWASEPATEAR